MNYYEQNKNTLLILAAILKMDSAWDHLDTDLVARAMTIEGQLVMDALKAVYADRTVTIRHLGDLTGHAEGHLTANDAEVQMKAVSLMHASAMTHHSIQQAQQAQRRLLDHQVVSQAVHDLEMALAVAKDEQGRGQPRMDVLKARVDRVVVDQVAGSQDQPVEFLQAVDEAEAAFRDPDQVEVHPSGLEVFDYISAGGLRPGTFVAVAARPNVGKTRLMLAIAKSAAEHGLESHFFGLESTRKQLNRLAMGAHYKASGKAMNGWDADTWTHKRSQAAGSSARVVGAFHLYPQDQCGSLTALTSRIHQAVRKASPGVQVVAYIDYLQLIHLVNAGKMAGWERLAHIAKVLANLAKSTGVIIVAAVQINRDAANKEPTLSNLKGSGDIEQAVDQAFLLWRQDDRYPDILTMKRAKSRSASVGLTIGVRASFASLEFERT